MAKRRTYEQILYDNLITKLEPKKWYDITKKEDYDKMVTAIKQFIDKGEPFLFSDDYRMIRYEAHKSTVWHKETELPNGMTIEHIEPGTEIIVNIKGTYYTHVLVKSHYQIFFNGKHIATEK